MKFAEIGKTVRIYDVAPLAGAWIEIFPENVFAVSTGVAPLAGAWIEISAAGAELIKTAGSLPSRERGLKSFHAMKSVFHAAKVAPLAGAWIEIG